MSESTVEDGKHGFWEFKKYKEDEWFRFLIIVLLALGGIYLLSHRLADKEAAYEYARLDIKQLQQINRIYFDTSAATQGTVAVADTPGNGVTTAQPVPADTNRCHRAVAYIQNEFNDKVDSEQMAHVRDYLCSAKPLEAIDFLGGLRFRVESYFWLVGPEVYFEIVLWSWFGVLSSLLFNLGMIGRNSTTVAGNPQTQFDSSEVPYQFAKLFYAPLCTLAIVLGYNYFSKENIVDISSSKGVIVFSFIGGFYSARLIAFLDRLKEVLLPNSGTTDVAVQSAPVATDATGTVIDLQLDETIPADLRNEITEMGVGDAVVTLENQVNGTVISATRKSEDQTSVFVVDKLPMGKYTLKANWSKPINEEPVNLAGEQEVDINTSEKTITLTLKKSETEG